MYFSPVYGTLNENKLLRAQQNQEGDTDTVTVYFFLSKLRCRFSKLPKKGIPWILRQFTALNENNSPGIMEGTTKPRGGYQYPVCCQGVPLSGKKYDFAFHFDLVIEDVCFL